MNTYETKTVEQNGVTYRVDWYYDNDADPPWEECDGHGFVSECTTRDKKPGERVLCHDRGFKRYYDVAASQELALKEGWGVDDPKNKTKKQIAAEAVERDYQYLRAWCDDKWFYCGIVVTEQRIDADGYIYDGFIDSLWGIESDSEWYHESVIRDLIDEIVAQHNNQDDNRRARMPPLPHKLRENVRRTPTRKTFSITPTIIRLSDYETP